MLKLLRFILGLQKKAALRKLRRQGKTEEQAAAERIIDGSVWDEFCDTLKAAGGSVLAFGSPGDPLTRAEGYRYLSRLVRAGLENFVEGEDPDRPQLKRLVHETVKMGNDNPDFFYRNARIDGAKRYRISGKLGTTPFIVFSTQDGDYSDNGGAAMPLAGQLSTDEMKIGPDGEIEIILSNSKEGPNWLRTTAETKMVMIRECFGDRNREEVADIRIELIGQEPDAPLLKALQLEEGLTRAGQLVAGASLMFAKWSRDFSKAANTLPLFDQAKSDAAGGDPQIAYYHSYWSLEEDRALVIESTVPQCFTWNCVLANHWLESLDYRISTIHVNKHTAFYRPDGSVRIIIARESPGLPNWLDPQGHSFGSLCFRWNRAENHPQPVMRSVPLEELENFRNEEKSSPSKKIDYAPRRPKGPSL